MRINLLNALLYLVSAMLLCEIGIKYEEVTLTKIKESPSSFKNMGVKVKVIFNSLTDNWIPVFTFFTSEKYINFAVWGYEEHIWYKKVLLHDYPYFYIRKDIDDAKKILIAKRYECFDLKGIVRNVYENRAWIEIEEVKKSTSACIDENILSLSIKANESFQEDDFIETLYFTEKLKNLTLPFELDKRIRDIRCFSYLQLNLKKEAMRCYRDLLSITGEEKYRMIIERLKKSHKKDKISKDTMLHIKKLQQIIKEQNIEIENLKREIEELKKGVFFFQPDDKRDNDFTTASVKNGAVINPVQTELSACEEVRIPGRRIVEKRLDKEELNALLEKKHKCIISKGYVTRPAQQDVKEYNRKMDTFRVSRRIIERRLDREEFEYLLSRSRKQL